MVTKGNVWCKKILSSFSGQMFFDVAVMQKLISFTQKKPLCSLLGLIVLDSH